MSSPQNKPVTSATTLRAQPGWVSPSLCVYATEEGQLYFAGPQSSSVPSAAGVLGSLTRAMSPTAVATKGSPAFYVFVPVRPLTVTMCQHIALRLSAYLRRSLVFVAAAPAGQARMIESVVSISNRSVIGRYEPQVTDGESEVKGTNQ